MKLAAFDGPSPKTPLQTQKSPKNLSHKPSYSSFCPKFRVGKKCNWQHLMAHSQKPPYRRKNLAKIFYASRVIAHFVPNFVAMAMGVGRGKMQLAAFDGPSPKNPLYAKNLAKIFYASRVTAHFVPNFVAMATGVGRGKMQLAAFDGPSPKTPLLAQKSLTQAEL